MGKTIRTKRNYSNLDGEVIDKDIAECSNYSGAGIIENFDAKLASSDIDNNPFDNENFYPASGGEDDAGKIGENEEDEFRSKMFSDASGTFGKGTIFDKEERKKRVHYKNLRQIGHEEHSNFLDGLFDPKARKARQDARAKARQTKADAKVIQAKAQQSAATSLNDNSGDIANAQALQALASAPIAGASKKGMSTGVKVGIGLGITAVVGIIIFVVVKKMKHKKA